MTTTRLKAFGFAISLTCSLPVFAAAPEAEMVSTEQFATEAAAFLSREIAAHTAAVESLDPPQKTVLGVPTAGDFTWGSFMRALAMVSSLTGETNVAGRNVPEFLGKLGLIESRQGGKTFSQLGAAITLRQFGLDLGTNALWQSLSPAEQNEWRALLNPERFYDIKTHHVINLPENYMGVAARIATYDYQMGIVSDRVFADDVLTRAAGQFLRGALYTDDNLPTGRYDRYSQEYARFIYDAADNLKRKDVKAAVEPALKAVMPTWWALVTPEGYGYPWGRTIGDMSYMDSMEIIGFLAEHPEFRPAPLAELASVYYAAWQSLQRDYETNHHLLNMFGFGRGNYHYMTVERQWQQTTAFLAKSADSLRLLTTALKAEKVSSFPARPQLPPVTRFDFFRKGDRPAGAWLVREGPLSFTLPITTGVQPGIADYLPAPHGLAGFAAPVEQLVPALVPYLELADGRTIVAGDGADEIVPGPDGRSLRVVWNHWAVVNLEKKEAELPYGQMAPLVDPGLTSQVTWTIRDGNTLVRTEKITATNEVSVRSLRFLFPSTGAVLTTHFLENGQRVDRFTGRNAVVDVTAVSPAVAFLQALQAPGNSPLGKGTRGAIPLIMNYQAANITITPDAPLQWTLTVKVTQR